MKTVNESTTAYVPVTFLDRFRVASQPTAATWRLDCLTTGAAVVTDTSLTVASGVAEVTIPAAATAILAPANARETKRLTVVAQYGSAADQVTGDYDFQVRNLRFVGV